MAARAHASKATIYSRWPDKAALVSAALEARSEYQPDAALDSGDLRRDLRELVGLFVHLAEEESLRAFVSVLLASTREPALLSSLESVALVRRRTDCRNLMERDALQSGSSLNGDALYEVILGKMLTSYLLERNRLTEEAQAEFIDRVLFPLIRNGTPISEGFEEVAP